MDASRGNIALEIILLLGVSFLVLVCATEIQEVCLKYPPPVNSQEGYIFKLAIEECQSRENCNIPKGNKLKVGTLSFIPSHNSTSLRLHLLLGCLDEFGGPIEMQIPTPPGDLCKVNNLSNAVGTGCIKKGKRATLSLTDYQIDLPRLMPTGNVNLTFLLTGDQDVLACAMVRAHFLE